MSMQDPIADMLTRIRNAQMVGKQEVAMPSSQMKLDMLKVMVDEGFIVNFNLDNEDNKPCITIQLKYHNNLPVITAIKRISRPGLRIYKKYRELPRVVGGLGIAVISTSKGIMSDRAARLAKMGGEVLCYIW